jgi:hypothetical protein
MLHEPLSPSSPSTIAALATLLLMLSTAQQTAAQLYVGPAQCLGGTGRLFWLHKEKLSWQAAMDTCTSARYKSETVTVDSAKVFQIVRELVAQQYPPGVSDSVLPHHMSGAQACCCAMRCAAIVAMNAVRRLQLWP